MYIVLHEAVVWMYSVKMFPYIFDKIHRKTPMPVTQVLLTQVLPCEFCEFFLRTHFLIERLRCLLLKEVTKIDFPYNFWNKQMNKVLKLQLVVGCIGVDANFKENLKCFRDLKLKTFWSNISINFLSNHRITKQISHETGVLQQEI